MISIFKYFVPEEYDSGKKKEKDINLKRSNRLSKQAQDSKDRFEKSLLELEELLKKQNA
jgi:hypothetical protein